MALGYAAMSHKVGVATVTLGPGLTNTVTALVEGARGGTPLVLLCGDTSIEDREGLPNVDQLPVVTATGAGFQQLRSAKTVVEDVAIAFRRALAERRPIVLNMPVNLQWQDCEYTRPSCRQPVTRGLVSAGADIDDAVGIIAAARRPIVLVGKGAAGDDASVAAARLAARIEAPVATTLKAKDLFHGRSHALGIFGTLSSPAAVEAILASDCIIALGASLNPYTAGHGTFLKGKRVVQVCADPRELGAFAQPDVGLIGDPGLVADLIHHWLDEAEVAPTGFLRELDEKSVTEAEEAPLPSGREGTVHVLPAMRFLDAAVPEDRILVTDGGRFLTHAWLGVRVQNPALFLSTLNFGSIGLGLSEAIGAAIAMPGRPTLAIVGDGGFMLGGLAEFNTAVRNACDLIVVVCNDGSYGAEHIQFRNKEMDPSLSMFDWPDFAPVAEALGGRGVTVRCEADFATAAQAIRERDRPLLIDIKLDPDAMPLLPQ